MFPKLLSASRVINFKIVGACVILFAYSPGVFKESFWSDDYGALMDTSSFVAHVLKDGRPVSAGLFSMSFSLLDGPANAWILRSLSLITLILIFLFISNLIKNSRHKNIGIFSIAIAFCLPSFQMYVHWSLTWFFLWATLAGLYAFHFWSSKLKARKIFAVFLLAIVLAVYPPTAVFYFSVITIVNVMNESKLSKFLSDTVHGLALLVISGTVSVLSIFMTMKFMGISANARVSIVTISEIPEKVVWLITRPLVVGMRPFMIDSPSPKIALITSIPMVLILAMGIRKQSIDLSESIFHRAIYLILPLILTLIPIIITSDNQLEFRVLLGYCWGTATLASYFLLVAIRNWLGSLNVNSLFKTFSILVVPSILVFVSISSINSHYRDLFESPYNKKNAFLNSKISSCFSSSFLENVLILPPKLPFPSLPRLGVFSTSTDLASSWVPKPNVELLLKLRGVNVSVTYLDVRPPDREVLTASCVIDLEDFRKSLI